MATGGSGESDVSEMFHRMGEKLGWFQHKDLDTALKAVSGELWKETVNILQTGFAQAWKVLEF